MSTSGANRADARRFHRLDDDVLLRYERLDRDGEHCAAAPDATADTTDLIADLDRDIGKALNALWGSLPSVAHAISLLNRKLSLVAAAALGTDHDDSGLDYEYVRVNLSGCGLAFETRERYAPGTRLRVNLVLFPSQKTIVVDGVVVGCEAIGGGESTRRWTRLDLDPEEAAQEQLIQHVVRTEQSRLAEREKR